MPEQYQWVWEEVLWNVLYHKKYNSPTSMVAPTHISWGRALSPIKKHFFVEGDF